jgi:DNA-binding CsgD family transcriptional regulator
MFESNPHLSSNSNGHAKPSVTPRIAMTWAAPIPEHLWPIIAEALTLSDRETAVVKRMLDDKKELAIAMELHISPHTVHTHVERIYRKLGVASRVELIRVVYGALLQKIAEPGSTLHPICGRRTEGTCPFAKP